jgi:putative tryptophan/tyrosine transport system substrate-binding protein
MSGMGRREFVALLSGAAAAWPVAVPAQQQTMPIIGFLRNTSAASSAHLVTAFRHGLAELGYIEGQNLHIEFRWSEGRENELRDLALHLVRRPVAVIVAANLTSLVAAKAATDTIPIVFITGDDPIQLGFVASFNRPAENITGVSFYSGTLGAKQMELLHEILPNATTIGMIVNPNNPAAETQINVAEGAARALRLKIAAAETRSEQDFEPALAKLIQQDGAGARLIGGDALLPLGTSCRRFTLPANL